MSAPNHYSITISTHTDISIWRDLQKDVYTDRKIEIEEAMLKVLEDYFPDLKFGIKYIKSGTPKTFLRYVNRESVGGIPLLRDYFRLNYPYPSTKDNNIFRVGDTIFPGQGIPGVVMGAMNCYALSSK